MHELAWGVDTYRILGRAMAPFSTLISVFTVGIVLSQSPENILTAAYGPIIQIPADGILHAVVAFGTKVITITDCSSC